MENKYQAIVVTPVKNALENTLATIKAVAASNIHMLHIVYDDYSDAETSKGLKENQVNFDYHLIHLSELTDTPSPNYKTVLIDAQAKALAANIPLILVESDVEVKKDTFKEMLAFAAAQPKAAMVGAVTVGYDQKVNFPYLKFKDENQDIIDTNRSLSFCCTLLSVDYLSAYSFLQLDSSKDWFDTIISHKATALGFKNYVLMQVSVLHKPHGSRPWKQLKYSNPLRYYWLKFTKGRDKI